jgi:hypothetical protein
MKLRSWVVLSWEFWWRFSVHQLQAYLFMLDIPLDRGRRSANEWIRTRAGFDGAFEASRNAPMRLFGHHSCAAVLVTGTGSQEKSPKSRNQTLDRRIPLPLAWCTPGSALEALTTLAIRPKVSR